MPPKNEKIITGPSTVLRLIFQHLKKTNPNTVLINLFQAGDNDYRSIGNFSFKRSLFIFYKGIEFLRIPLTRNSLVYIFVSPSNVGLIRDFMFILFASIRGNRIILHQLGNYMNFFESKSLLTRYLIKTFSKKVNKIIVEGKLVENFFIDKGFSNNFIVIPNCAPSNKKVILEKNKSSKFFRILYLSNLIPSKGYFSLLKSLLYIDKNIRSKIVFTFVGKFMDVKAEKVDGRVEKDIFFDFIKKNNLSKNIQYIESAWGKEKYDLYKNSDIFVLPTDYIYEMQPISIIEAMSCGLPIISSKKGLIPYMVEDMVNGLILEKINPKSIALKILMLIKNPELFLKMQKNNLEKYTKNYSEKAFLKNIDKLI